MAQAPIPAVPWVREKALADALARLGAPKIEKMAWSFFREPPEYIGDSEFNERQVDDFPMQSLARAILKELG